MKEIISIPGFAEPLSCLTHLLTGIAFIYLSFDLLARVKQMRDSSIGARLALLSFSVSCVFLLLMSGVFHLLPHGRESREILQRLDHSGIFLFIAGTITAVEFLCFEGIKRRVVITGTWLLAITGIVLKLVFFNEITPELGACLYLAFGWIGVISAVSLYRKHSFSFIKPLLFGAVAYTIGAFCDTLGEPTLIVGVIGPHEVFHIMVIIGMAAHWQFIFNSLPIYDQRNSCMASAVS